jgi:hypothetical protein
MPLDQSDGITSLDSLRSQQVNADSGAAINENDVADLTAAFKKHAQAHHDQIASEESDTADEIKGHMDAFAKGAGDQKKLQEAIDRYQALRLRRRFYNEAFGVPAVRGGFDIPEGPSTPGSLPGPDTNQSTSQTAQV